MRYISLNEIRKTINSTIDLSDSSNHAEIIRLIESARTPGEYKIGDQSYTISEIMQFLSSLNDKQIVFFDWVEQHKALQSLLLGGFPKTTFNDIYRWKEHRLFPEFQSFLLPFLQNTLLKYRQEKSIEKLGIVFSFMTLLPADERMIIEQELFKSIQDRINRNRESLSSAKTENELLSSLQEICNDSITDIVNYLSRASYATKLWYVDQLLWVVQQQACTLRLANWILKQLEKIELNPEHQEKVSSLKLDLKHGNIRVKNANFKKGKTISLKKILLIISFTFLCLFTVWIIREEPFSKTEDDLFDNTTAYEQFSKEERKKIDSLLRDIQRDRSDTDNQIDPNMPIYGYGISLALRTPLKNELMEKIYTDLVTDADLHNQGLIDSCVAFSQKDAENQYYKGFVNASKNKGTYETILKNESDYDVYLFIFENKKKGANYSCLIKKGNTFELKLSEKDHLLFVAGNRLAKFIPPVGATELPSKEFDHHFCKVDINYEESLSNIYYLANPQKGKNKLLISGNINGYFSVIDLYGVLELM